MTRAVVSVVALICALSACSDGDAARAGVQPVVQPEIYVLPTTTLVAPIDVETSVAPRAVFVTTADGVVLPDPVVTPGAVFADVQAADICDLHYTLGIRQPRYNDKVLAFANYGVSIHDRDIFQVDHLIPISLGGSNAETNIWPQPYDDDAGAAQKDLVERQLRGLVCSNKLSLQEAQAAVAGNWWAAFQTYMGIPIDPGSDGLPQYERPVLEPGEVANGAPCDQEGLVGYTTDKHIRLTCTATGFGELQWQKRY